MHPRNLHLYFFSPTGGTQRVAGLFAENLNAADACTDITVHAEAKTFSADDCLLVFFPVYGGRVPGPCLARMRAPARDGHSGRARGRVRQPRRGRRSARNARYAHPAGLSRDRGGGGHRAALGQHRHRRRPAGRSRLREDRRVLHPARGPHRRRRPGRGSPCPAIRTTAPTTACRSSRPAACAASAAACARTTAPPARSRRPRRRRWTSISASPVCAASRSARSRPAACRCRCGWPRPPR